jgi:hypothetical protein
MCRAKMIHRLDVKRVNNFRALIDVAFSYGKQSLDTFKLNNFPTLSRDMLAATKFRISLIYRFINHLLAVSFFNLFFWYAGYFGTFVVALEKKKMSFSCAI